MVSEVALSIVLLAGAGLLLRSFWRVLEVRPGFNPSHLTTVQIWIPISNNPANDPYSVEEKRADFLLEVFRRVSALPGVEQASISGNDTLPMNSGRNYSPFSIQGRAAESERGPIADIAVVDTQYFRTMEVPLIAGRNFTGSDTYKTQPVAVIDQTLARQYWQDKNPLGQQLKFGFGRGLQGVTIVGVVGDIKSDGFEAPSVPHIYVALGQFAPVNAVVFLRSRGDVEHLGEAVRHEVESVDPNVPVHSISSMDQIIARSVADRRFALELLGVFAAGSAAARRRRHLRRDVVFLQPAHARSRNPHRSRRPAPGYSAHGVRRRHADRCHRTGFRSRRGCDHDAIFPVHAFRCCANRSNYFRFWCQLFLLASRFSHATFRRSALPAWILSSPCAKNEALCLS